MITFFLSKIIGIYFIIASCGFFINPNHCKKTIDSILNSYGLRAICSSLATITGLLIILNHNIWKNLLQAAISTIGWTIFVLGLVFVIFPKLFTYLKRKKEKPYQWMVFNFIIFFLGFFLTYMGFVKKP